MLSQARQFVKALFSLAGLILLCESS